MSNEINYFSNYKSLLEKLEILSRQIEESIKKSEITATETGKSGHVDAMNFHQGQGIGLKICSIKLKEIILKETQDRK